MQFVRVDNLNDYQAVYNVISTFMTNEDFILVEGYDYQTSYLHELLYLALGGSQFIRRKKIMWERAAGPWIANERALRRNHALAALPPDPPPAYEVPERGQRGRRR